MTITAQCRYSDQGFTAKAIYEFYWLRRSGIVFLRGENDNDFLVTICSVEFNVMFKIKEITHD